MKQAKIIMDSGREYIVKFEGDTNTFINNLFEEKVSEVCDLKAVNSVNYISLKHVSSVEIETIR